MLFNSHSMTVFLQEIIKFKCIVLLIYEIKGQPGGPREEAWTESGACRRAFLGTDLREVTAEVGHCDHGAQLLLLTDEETEAQRLA